MAGRKGTSLATRSRSAPKVVSPRNKTYVALPFSKFTVQEPMKMTVGDWISLAGHGEAIKKFAILGEDFTEEGGQLTPTLKVRRTIVMERYAVQIAALYDDSAS